MVSQRDLPRLLLPILLSIINLLVLRATADAMVTGTVFCDQCKDGERSLFDYPLVGAKVAVTCGGTHAEDVTNWFGSYAVRFEGIDLSACTANIVSAPQVCGMAGGPPQGLRLVFRMFGLEMYTVDPLLAQPVQPMPFCRPNSGSGDHPPSPPTLPLLPPTVPGVVQRPPLITPQLPPPVPGVVQHPPPIPRQFPPTVPGVVQQPPPTPFTEPSACPYDKWMMPKFRCYWRVVSPDTKVAMTFGLLAAAKYGLGMTLWDGLQGRGDLYRTLLREATTALLNSYNSVQFLYPTPTVINNMNWALLGTPQEALVTALRFRRANSGAFPGQGLVSCNFSPCS